MSDETTWRSPLVEVPGTVLGGLASAALVAFLGARGGAPRRLDLLVRVLQPVSIAIVLVVPIVNQWMSGVAVAYGNTFFSVVGFSLLTGVAFVEIALTVGLAGVPARRCAGLFLAGMALACAAGMGSIEALGTNGRTLCFVLEAVFFTAVAISYALRSRTSAEDARPDDAPVGGASGTPQTASDDAGLLEARCRHAAELHRLSPRETDVLLYIGRGYGSSFIAPQLGISENTVRTHVRHIYEKLGVSSREELIAYIDGLHEGL